jgi:hypothetical protein
MIKFKESARFRGKIARDKARAGGVGRWAVEGSRPSACESWRGGKSGRSSSLGMRCGALGERALPRNDQSRSAPVLGGAASPRPPLIRRGDAQAGREMTGAGFRARRAYFSLAPDDRPSSLATLHEEVALAENTLSFGAAAGVRPRAIRKFWRCARRDQREGDAL